MRFIVICGMLLFWLTGCSDWNDPALVRAKRAQASNEDIVIGVVVPWENGHGAYWRGIALAVEEINSSGGVLGRKLKVVRDDDQSELDRGRLIAQKFAEDLDMVAVIGHVNSYIAIPASAIYQSAGLLMLSPGATSSNITERDYNLVFRSSPSNLDYGEAMANYAFKKGHKSVIVAYVKEMSSRQLANAFEQRCKELGIHVVDRRPFYHGATDFTNQLENWKDFYRFDAMFLAMHSQEGGRLISQARKLDITAPIFGGDGLDNFALWEIAGTAAEGVAVPEDYSPTHAAAIQFDSAFSLHYQEAPSDHSALGYDAVQLIANAIRGAGTTVPAKVSDALRATKNWQGVTRGTYTFDSQGATSGMNTGFKVLRNGKYELEP